MEMLSIRKILGVYKTQGVKKAKKLEFLKVGRQDVYNITAPFKFKKDTYIIGRVEPRDFEEASRIIFFKKKNAGWVPDEKCPEFSLQDPFLTKIGNTFLLGGVKVESRAGKTRLYYRTIFYKGSNIYSLREFAKGPWGMKSIRLIKLPNGKIGVFTRPQGKKGLRGRIGFTIIDSLDKLSSRTLSRADIIHKDFPRGEWEGINDVLILTNGKIGVLGHVARFSKGRVNRFYYPMVFCFDPETRKSSTIRIIVRRAELPEGESKRSDLYNVVYPGGIIREKNNKAKLYAGVGDAEAYEITLMDPFKYYEEKY